MVALLVALLVATEKEPIPRTYGRAILLVDPLLSLVVSPVALLVARGDLRVARGGPQDCTPISRVGSGTPCPGETRRKADGAAPGEKRICSYT